MEKPALAPIRPRGVRTPQQARSRRTRERVLTAAISCFEERGYDETTTAAIAERAGIAVGTLYGYFRDKRDILLEVAEGTVHEVAEYVIERLHPESWRGSDPREVIRSLIDAVFHSQKLRPGMQRIMWERFFKDPEFRGPVLSIRQRVQDALAEFLQAAGALEQRAVDPKVASFVIVNAVQWNATQAFMTEDPSTIDATAASTSDLITGYVFAEEARDR